jgi:hypothetical protein
MVWNACNHSKLQISYIKLVVAFYKNVDNFIKSVLNHTSASPFHTFLANYAPPSLNLMYGAQNPCRIILSFYCHLFTNEAAKLPLQIVTYRKFWKLYKSLLQRCTCKFFMMHFSEILLVPYSIFQFFYKIHISENFISTPSGCNLCAKNAFENKNLVVTSLSVAAKNHCPYIIESIL